MDLVEGGRHLRGPPGRGSGCISTSPRRAPLRATRTRRRAGGHRAHESRPAILRTLRSIDRAALAEICWPMIARTRGTEAVGSDDQPARADFLDDRFPLRIELTQVVDPFEPGIDRLMGTGDDDRFFADGSFGRRHQFPPGPIPAMSSLALGIIMPTRDRPGNDPTWCRQGAANRRASGSRSDRPRQWADDPGDDCDFGRSPRRWRSENGRTRQTTARGPFPQYWRIVK